MSKKFEITCLNCGSNNVSIEEEIDYDWDEMPYINGYFLRCDDCGNDDCNDNCYEDEEENED